VPEPYFSLFPEADVPDRAAGPEVLAARGGKWRWQGRLTENALPGYDSLWRRYRANYCGMLRLLDDQVRRLLTYLETRDLLASTLLVFTTDCGEYTGEYGLQRKGVGLPECLVRVPLLFAGPGIAPRGGLREEFVSLVDVFPTLCEALGVEVPRGVQGRSLWPLLAGGALPPEEFRSIYVEFGAGGLDYAEDDLPPANTSVSDSRYRELNAMTLSGRLKLVRLGDWKLIMDTHGRGELYHLATDPAELRDRYHDPACRDERQRLTEELVRWMIRAEDDLPLGLSVPKWAAHNWYAAASDDGAERTPTPGAPIGR
jgi:arylsulfatase A-like enzyme